MNKDEFKTIDAFGEEFTPTKDDFQLVQQDKKIHDKKFDTKPTTFAKDAFKRFCKNKSSVVGAIIIGLIVLLSIIVPFAVPYDTEESKTYEKFIEPKLFQAGTGWWDGTKYYDKVALLGPSEDIENFVAPEGFEKEAILNYKEYQKDGSWYASFNYDTYEAAYGIRKSYDLPLIELQNYKRNGWCDFDENDVKGTFKKLSEECPVNAILSDISSTNTFKAEVVMYKYLGYSSMPTYLFGTDQNGHDLAKVCFIGIRSSLLFAIAIAAICFTFGLCWGAMSGYFGGNVDLFMERFCEILGGVPLVVIVTLFRLHLGGDMWVFVLALCVTGWLSTAARTRTQFYRFKGREYVLASRTLGSSDTRLIFKHILPNSLGTIVTSSVLMIPSLIFTESSLAYLGLGLQGSHSFGTILSNNQVYITTNPILIVFPAIIISLLMISFNLFGNGLRDALNPSLKGSD